MHRELAATANLLGEPARAAMLLKLMGGRALPAGELAVAANISPQTASGHLAKLVEGSLLHVEQHGRHRYYRLLRADVADTLEALLTLTARAHQRTEQKAVVPKVGTLAHARTCYTHLAGWLGVQIAYALQAKNLLAVHESKAFTITENGSIWLRNFGIAVPVSSSRPSTLFAKQCLDWTERRPHVAGVLGVALYKQLVALHWVVPIAGSRAVRVTIEGKRQLWKQLGVAIG